jgi:hypothetical protein
MRWRFLATLALLTGAVASEGHDFRNADWGMTKEQVIASETGRASGEQEVDSQVLVSFDSPDAADLPGQLIYVFVNGRLAKARYIAKAQHAELNDYVADFAGIEPKLAEKYGKLLMNKAIWLNDTFQLERLPYLEQDRAHATDILPSDRNVGLSIAAGHLKMITERESVRTRVLHALSGENSVIVHQIEYQSRAIRE